LRPIIIFCPFTVMMLLLQFLFWGSVLAMFHSYVCYPLLLRWQARGKQLNSNTFTKNDELPYIIVLMAAYNEASIIAQKLDSVFQTDYPEDNFEVIIGSDGSTDQTDQIISDYANRYDNLILNCFEGRNGKPNILNQLMQRYGKAINSFGNNCVLIMTDANILFAPNTLYELAKHFKNQDIGIVGSFVHNCNLKNDGISLQENAYINRENDIKYLESMVNGCMMGVFGACYALRANLFTPIPHNFIVEDFFMTLSVLKKGQKAICDPKAICYEDIPNEMQIEFKRKKRISAGNFQNLRHFAHLLMPNNNGIWFAFLSHKVLRWLGPLFILLALGSSLILAQTYTLYHWAVVLQLMLLCLPFVDYILRMFNIHNSLLRFVSYFYVMNLALLLGLGQYLRGIKSNAWSPTQR
jgi:cellulose synthase/poly-beta-1,6-N-acetylglucosamine synthase-like glycosyltransferase